MRNVIISACLLLIGSLLLALPRQAIVLDRYLMQAPPGDDSTVSPSEPKRKENYHVVFSQYRCATKKCSEATRIAEENSRLQWSNLSSRVIFLGMLNDTETNKFRLPLLRSLYLKAASLHPDAATYTYVNGDILPRHDFHVTLDAVTSMSEQVWNNTGFMIVGRRADVDWKQHKTSVLDSGFRFDDFHARGNLQPEFVEDFFCVSRNAIAWQNIPPFVIGRVGYDNWLVNYVYHKPDVHLVDATLSIKVIHQSNEGGSRARGGGKKINEDYWWNHDVANNDTTKSRGVTSHLAKRKWFDHGHTTHARWVTSTSKNDTGSVFIKLRGFGNPETWKYDGGAVVSA